MVQIRVVRMGVPQFPVAVPVRVGLGRRTIVSMLMVRVMDMSMLMLEQLVDMLVLMPLRQVEP